MGIRIILAAVCASRCSSTLLGASVIPHGDFASFPDLLPLGSSNRSRAQSLHDAAVASASAIRSAGVDVLVLIAPHALALSNDFAVYTSSAANGTALLGGDLYNASVPLRGVTASVRGAPALGSAVAAELANVNVSALLAWGDSEPAPLRWSEIVPLSLLGLNTSALDAPAVVVISLPLRRLTDAAGMVPELLALGGSLRRVLDAPGAPRAWIIVSADLAHTHPAGVNPYAPNASAADGFDAAIGQWLETLSAPPLVDDAASLAATALSCGFTGMVLLHGALAGGAGGLGAWVPRVWQQPVAPTYYGMAVATFSPRTADTRATTTVPLTTPPLNVLGAAPVRGIFDPSVLATGNASTPYVMTFSSVTATDDISTDFAVYDAALHKWVAVSRVNAAALNVTLPCAGGVPCDASLIHEVSSVVVDAADADAARRIKVFAHTYAVTGGSVLHYDIGYISLSTAPGPLGPWTTVPLLGWAGASPFSTAGVRQVLTDIPALADCLLFTEPGALVNPSDGRLLLALGCASAPRAAGATAPIRVVLLSSADSGMTWTLEAPAPLVDGAIDAARLGFTVPQLNAADLFVARDGDVRLIISPSAELAPDFIGYAGCLVLRVLANLSGVERDVTGAPLVERSVVPSATAFAGACTAAVSDNDADVGGYLMPTLLGDVFAILPSEQPPV